MSGWQPIETAPKDGTSVLLLKDCNVHVARWIQSEAMGPVWCTPDSHVIFRATMWHELPEPPK